MLIFSLTIATMGVLVLDDTPIILIVFWLINWIVNILRMIEKFGYEKFQ
jgi:hypothetical protein